LSIIALIAVAVSFGMAVFSYIDHYFPDLATDYYWSRASYESSIRQAMAILIVVFPVFLWVSRFLNKDIVLHPEKRELKIRKWLLNLTIFAAALVIIGDLVTVINNFLRGELTMRFVLKSLTIFFISGSAFYYYLKGVRYSPYKLKEGVRHSPYKVPDPLTRALPWIIVAVVVWAVAWGFVVIGSPFEQRERRFDEKRVNDLQTIQSQLVNYWQRKGSLPVNLNELEDSISGFLVPVDSQTSQAYEYSTEDKKLKFRLCATFNKAISGEESRVSLKPVLPRGEFSDNWRHDSGRQCFDRTIDPEFYPKVKNL
jgi:hypothetical protein